MRHTAPARERSMLAFWLLMPLVCTVLSMLGAGVLALVLTGIPYVIAFPPVALVVLALGGFAAGAVVATGWLWIALWRPDSAPLKWVATARVFTLAGGALAAFFAVVAIRSQWPGSPYHPISPLSVAFLQAQVAATGLALALAWLWRGPSVRVPMRRPALGTAAVAAFWLLCGGTAILSHTALVETAHRAVVKAHPEEDLQTREPVARALCDGRLAQAELALRQADADPNVAVILHNCLAGIGDTGGRTGVVYFNERLPLALASVLLAERRAGIDSKAGCTRWQQVVLAQAFGEEVSVALKFREYDLRIDCMETGRSPATPLWWRAVQLHPDRTSMADLLILQELQVDWQQRSQLGETLLQDIGFLTSAAPHLSNALLRFLVDHAASPATDLSALGVDLMRRRFDRHLNAEDRQWLQTVIGRHAGEATREQLRRHAVEVVHMLSEPATDAPALTAYLGSRLELPNGADKQAVLAELQRR